MKNIFVTLLKSLILTGLILVVWTYYATADWESSFYISPIGNLLLVIIFTGVFLFLGWPYWFGRDAVLLTIVFLVFAVVVLSSLNTATDSKPGDWHNIAVKRSLSAVRIQAVLYEDTNGGYASSSIPTSFCYSSDNYHNSMFEDPTTKDYLLSIKKYVSTGATCALTTTPSAFAVSAPLYQQGKYWCVDNAGFSGAIDGPITKAVCK